MARPPLPSSPPPPPGLPQRAREHFVRELEGVVVPLGDTIRNRLLELVDSSSSVREGQERRDAMVDFEQKRRDWQQGTVKEWRKAVVPPTATAMVRLEALNLELIGDDVVENKILSSRLALVVAEKAGTDLNDLKTRMQHLEGGEELSGPDVLRPEAVVQTMVEQWTAAGLARPVWLMVQDVIQKAMVERLIAAYKSTNAMLVKNGVLPDVNLSARVKRVEGRAPRKAAAAPGTPEGAQAPTADPAADGGMGAGGPGGGYGGQPGGQGPGPGGPAGPGTGGNGGESGNGYVGGGGADGGYQGGGGYAGQPGGGGYGGQGAPAGGGGGYGGAPGGGGQGQPGGMAGGGSWSGGGAPGAHGAPGAAGGAPGGYGGAPGAFGGAPGTYGGGMAGGMQGVPGGMQGGVPGAESSYYTRGLGGAVNDETRMQTATTPLARARMRASGVVGQLRRLLVEKVGLDPSSGSAGEAPSPELAEAIQRQRATGQPQTHVQSRMGAADAGATVNEVVVYDDAAVQQAAVDLRERTGELKKKASTQTEKATIEIVALMFQSILAEERIPAAVRVWFARLQMPVLRVALAEPEFFGTLQHPARQLIDRMGSCVLGFNAATIGGSALEVEIRRVVQTIEQYPETGRRVFQLVYDEFQKFLAKFLTEKNETQRLVTVAQQVEQKEAMAIQYTIELRRMLNDVPVRDEIREFLFKVWAEVLAVAAVRHGPQHAQTIAMKKSAADLVWSAGAKPNRAERAKVIQDLPGLLQRLRGGMTLLGLESAEQEKHIKSIGDTIADAFMSKTETIPQAQIDAMGKRLANLEDFISDGDGGGELQLDAHDIEMMLGIDASMITVVTDGGSKPTDAMMAWALELQQGNWFTLDHNGKVHNVQYVWRSDRRQLHLFASSEGKSFLVQLRRLASYLQAGLLLPAEEETLTVRATRDALAKLDANPERLLS